MSTSQRDLLALFGNFFVDAEARVDFRWAMVVWRSAMLIWALRLRVILEDRTRRRLCFLFEVLSAAVLYGVAHC